MHEANDARVVQHRIRLGFWQAAINRENGTPFARIVIILAMVISPQWMGCMGAKPPYVIQDTGVHAEESGNELVWLDNHRVRFYGYQDWKPQGPEFHGVPRLIGAGYYIWNTETGQLVTEPSLDGVRGICVHGDVLTFIKKSPIDENKRLVVTRVKGQESVAPLVNAEWFNRFSCRYYEHKPAWIIEGYRTLPLMDGHGYLIWAYPLTEVQSVRNWPLRFHLYNAKEEISLPIGMQEIWHNLVKYAPFRDAYLLYPVTYVDHNTGKQEPIGPWPHGKPVPMWWLKPDGTVLTEEVPYMSFMRGGSRGFFPTREGIFISTHKTDDLGKPGDAGGYLARDGDVRRVISGILGRVSISPDGCRIAFIHDPYDTIYEKDRLTRINVKIINVCGEIHHVH